MSWAVYGGLETKWTTKTVTTLIQTKRDPRRNSSGVGRDRWGWVGADGNIDSYDERVHRVPTATFAYRIHRMLFVLQLCAFQNEAGEAGEQEHRT